MGTDTQTDAEYLWEDVLVLLEERGLAPAVLAMLRSCTPVGLDDESLTIATNLSFARRKIEQEGEVIEQCLREAAFQPLKLRVELSRTGAPVPAPTTATVVSPEELSQLQPAEPAPAQAPQPVAAASPLRPSSVT